METDTELSLACLEASVRRLDRELADVRCTIEQLRARLMPPAGPAVAPGDAASAPAEG